MLSELSKHIILACKGLYGPGCVETVRHVAKCYLPPSFLDVPNSELFTILIDTLFEIDPDLLRLVLNNCVRTREMNMPIYCEAFIIHIRHTKIEGDWEKCEVCEAWKVSNGKERSYDL